MGPCCTVKQKKKYIPRKTIEDKEKEAGVRVETKVLSSALSNWMSTSKKDTTVDVDDIKVEQTP